MTNTLEKIKEMKIAPGTLIEIHVGSNEVRPGYFAGVDSIVLSYYERVIESMDDPRSHDYINNVQLGEIDSIILREGWGKVK